LDWLTRKLKPMLAYSSPPFDSPEYIMEVKWDGTRCLVFIGRGLRLQNRRLLEIGYRYPELHNLPQWIKAREVILDGEIVILVNGKPSFSKLQEREHISEENRIKILSRIIPATYIVFDLLYLNGKLRTNEPLSIRKELLETHVVQNEFLVISQFVDQYGIKFYKEAVTRGLEGIMAKRKNSRYLIGKRSEDWLKIKKFQSIDAVICGYTEGQGRYQELFGSLVLGLYYQKKLQYVGQVGTGFSSEEMQQLLKILKGLKIRRCPFPEIPEIARSVQWVKPEIVCEVEFMEWTAAKKLRAPRYRRLRWDKPLRECVIPG